MNYTKTVERWDMLEIAVSGKTKGNPFTDYTVTGTFTGPGETKAATGFYDGDGVYRVRFMPSFEGHYTFALDGTYSDRPQEAGEFDVTPAGPGNHGPVRVRGFHFEYEDGTPFYPMGTTAYVWELQKEALHQQTLETLKQGYFNKIRLLILSYAPVKIDQRCVSHLPQKGSTGLLPLKALRPMNLSATDSSTKSLLEYALMTVLARGKSSR